jgi:hypothetical protein
MTEYIIKERRSCSDFFLFRIEGKDSLSLKFYSKGGAKMKGYFMAFILVFVLTLGIGLTEAQAADPLPDLIVSGLTVQPSTLAGINIYITDVTQNKQTATASAPISVTRYYLSKDKKVNLPKVPVHIPTDTKDMELALRIVPTLDPGDANTGSRYVHIPLGIVPGEWYIIALADSEQLKVYGGDGIGIDELYEDNNRRVKLINIYASNTLFPDLTVTALNAPDNAAPGEVISVGETTKNLGPAGSPISLTKIYLSTDSTLDGSDVALVDDNNILVLGLNAGASKANNISVTIPDDTAPGSYYIIAKADGVNLITEVAENNNAMSKAITISEP